MILHLNLINHAYTNSPSIRRIRNGISGVGTSWTHIYLGIEGSVTVDYGKLEWHEKKAELWGLVFRLWNVWTFWFARDFTKEHSIIEVYYLGNDLIKRILILALKESGLREVHATYYTYAVLLSTANCQSYADFLSPRKASACRKLCPHVSAHLRAFSLVDRQGGNKVCHLDWWERNREMSWFTSVSISHITSLHVCCVTLPVLACGLDCSKRMMALCILS